MTPRRAGIGLRRPHYEAFLETAPAVEFVEVHSENFFGDGGAALAVLQAARARVPVSLHGVGLGLGSAVGLDDWHLDRLARLVQRIDPVLVSDHASFARAPLVRGGPIVHANDLLPLPCTDAALDILVANVDQVQSRLGRSLLVENLASYLRPPEATMREPEFYVALCRRSGCRLLLDLNNLVVNALNDGAEDVFQACAGFIDALPPGCVGEIHLAGHAEADGCYIDDHGSPVGPTVWRLYAHAVRRFGAVATLVEWDTDLPALDVLLREAEHAAAISGSVRP